MNAACQDSVATTTSAAGRTPNWYSAIWRGTAAASSTHPPAASTKSACATVNISITSATPCADIIESVTRWR